MGSPTRRDKHRNEESRNVVMIMKTKLLKSQPGKSTAISPLRKMSPQITGMDVEAGIGSKERIPAWARLPEINTWRAFEENISQPQIMEFVEQWEAHGFRFSCLTIDEGWTPREAAFGDWVPDERRFPNLRSLVDWLHRKDIRVRLWVAPVCVNEGARLARSPLAKHFLVGQDGRKIRQLGRDALLLDVRQPTVQEFVVDLFERLTRDYDVDAYKVDFCLTKDATRPSGYPNDNFSDHDRVQFHRDLFGAVHRGCGKVKEGVRIETYPLEHCAEYIHDVMYTDLVGPGRNQKSHETINGKLLNWERAHGWVAWPEMVWGLGSDTPMGNPDWERTYLEWLATDINYERKLELSFPPFDYGNCAQIRALSNLYACGGAKYKVAHAGQITFDLERLIEQGIELTPSHHFLAAPNTETEIHFVVPPCCGMPSQWEVINLLHSERVRWQVRDENWEDGKRWHCLRFPSRAGAVYEIRPCFK